MDHCHGAPRLPHCRIEPERVVGILSLRRRLNIHPGWLHIGNERLQPAPGWWRRGGGGRGRVGCLTKITGHGRDNMVSCLAHDTPLSNLRGLHPLLLSHLVRSLASVKSRRVLLSSQTFCRAIQGRNGAYLQLELGQNISLSWQPSHVQRQDCPQRAFAAQECATCMRESLIGSVYHYVVATLATYPSVTIPYVLAVTAALQLPLT